MKADAHAPDDHFRLVFSSREQGERTCVDGFL